MRLLLLLPLFALACASPQQYERGTAVRPPAPAMRPGVGLPRYDRPLPALPRTAPRFVAPRSSAREPEPLLGWKAPAKLDGGPDNDDLPAYCVDAAREKLDTYLWGKFQEELSREDPQMARCHAALTWAYCIEGALLQFELARARDKKPSLSFWDYKRIGKFVQELVHAECKGIRNMSRYIWRGPG